MSATNKYDSVVYRVDDLVFCDKETYAYKCGYLKSAAKWALAELEKGRLASAVATLRRALAETGEEVN